ncbi:tetratricopeptide repeat protein [filamentous cyanobacterium LEGE 11480]|uniref:Tetratricopeptide repeat protein n=1 Tax=Romeriopsis navalis LEGE 11480 TaxID=2777977 RepID=A0A928VIC0_9CYAN|nr:tetratricopeptide repeat protein [Romeriopsis navalis]MBE9028298.1 tetratricopeptide repeat protein [Romeriopsis navalis LEGE 11480]
MDTESIVTDLDRALAHRTGRRLNHLQRMILQQVYQGYKYREIADAVGYTEGHIKDVGSDLWKLLSKAFNTKFTKSNCKAMIKRSLQSAGLYKPENFIPPVGDIYRSSPTPDVAPLAWEEVDFNIEAQDALDPIASFDVPNRTFMGRSTAMAQLHHLSRHQGHPIIVIQGTGGLGKTTLAQHFLHQQPFEIVLELLMAKETQHITPADRVIAEWLKQDFGVEAGSDFGVSLSRLQRQLQQQPVGILIDNLETALDAQGQFIPEHRQYLELLRVLSLPRNQSTTLITSRDRLCEVDANLVHYRLPGLTVETWIQFFQQTVNPVESTIIQQLCHAYGGNAKAMGLIAGTVQTDFEQDLTAYWQNHQTHQQLELDLTQLVLNQIRRLQQLDTSAYWLLCRMSCYRYQDVAQLPIAALRAMLWDTPNDQQTQVINALERRSLLEFSKGKYWLHPVVREVAIAQLRQSDEWDQANTAAALFWTTHIQQILTQQDALAALESYHHYIAINDYANAAKSILRARHNQWHQHLPLGCTLHRMGFVKPTLIAISTVIEQVSDPIHLGELNNILGDLHWISGNISQAIACQQQTIGLATTTLNTGDLANSNQHQIYYLKMLKVDAQLSLGLYYIDRWELPSATNLFEHVINEVKDTAHDRWAQKAQVCLAYVLAQQRKAPESLKLAKSVNLSPAAASAQPDSFAYFLQILGQTYAQLHDYKTAQTFYHQALTSAEIGEYPQVKARTLSGQAQLHRQLGEFESSIILHETAIALLETIGAKCDLAEAHLQFGLSYQAAQQNDQARKHLAIAQQLFRAIDAPQQLQRVELAIRQIPPLPNPASHQV